MASSGNQQGPLERQVPNDGKRPFTQIPEDEQETLRICYIINENLTVRAVSRQFDVTYGSLRHQISIGEWDKHRQNFLNSDQAVAANRYSELRAISRERLLAGIYDVFYDLGKVFKERARFAAQEGYFDHFDTKEFTEFVEFIAKMEPKFSALGSSNGMPQGNTASERAVNYLEVHLSKEEKIQYSGMFKMLMDQIAKPAWNKSDQNGKANVIDVQALPVIDPAKGETR